MGHTYRWKYMDCSLQAKITTPKPEPLLDKAKQAVTEAAVKTALLELLKGMASGGGTASTAGITFQTLLLEELRKIDPGISVQLDQACGWSAPR
ncbi:MAG: hypothetical protein QM612_01920 [Thermomonas sp.]|uniref:hypothetical protein n=1 Tax=Thermomonas sp. TaxID=1971895 RepID=UPI0039E514CC